MERELRHFAARIIGNVGRRVGDPSLKRLVKNVGWLLSGSTAAAFLALVGSALKARSLGPELFGILALVASFAGIVGRLATFQPWQAVIKFGAGAYQKGRYEELAGVVRLGLVLDAIGALVAAVVSLLGAFLVMPLMGWGDAAVQMAAVTTLSTVLGSVATPIAVLRILDRFNSLAIQQVITAALSLIGALFVYLLGGGIWAFFLTQTGAQVIGAFLLFGQTHRGLRLKGIPSVWGARISNWRPLVSFSSWNFLSSSVSLPVKQFDVMIVGSLISVRSAGIYKIVKQVVATLGMLANPVYQACYPQLAELAGENKARAAVKYAWRLGLLLLVPLVPIGLGLSATSSAWLSAIFGEAYASAAAPLAVFLVFTVVGMAAVPVHPLFLALGYARGTAGTTALSNALYLVVAFSLASSLGLMGIALAYSLQVITEIAVKTLVISARLRRHRQLDGRRA